MMGMRGYDFLMDVTSKCYSIRFVYDECAIFRLYSLIKFRPQLGNQLF